MDTKPDFDLDLFVYSIAECMCALNLPSSVRWSTEGPNGCSFDDSHDCQLMSKYSSCPQKVDASTQPLYFYNDLFSTSALTSKMICAGLYGYVRYAGLECAELCRRESYAFRLGGLR